MKRAKRFVRSHKTILRIAKYIKSKILPTHLHIFSFNESYMLTLQFAEKLPNDFDIIVGIPRSGLLVANLLALKLGRPLSTVDGFKRGEIWYSHDATMPKNIRRILLVEDSVASGNTLNRIVNELKQYNPELEIKTASLFINKGNETLVDYFAVSHERPNIYEWNILTARGYFGKLATDMDGILCENCPAEVDHDEKLYIEWLETVQPHLIPNYTIDAIITARLEKYRSQTETWLSQHNVKYKNLFMLDLPEKSERAFKKVIQHKVRWIRQIQPFLYWESNMDEAIAIHKKTHMNVLCTDRMLILS